MGRVLKTLLLWLVMLAIPLRGMAAIDTSCVRVAPQTAAVASNSSVSSAVEHAGHVLQDKGMVTDGAAKNSSDCGNSDSPHKVSTCSSGVCHMGAAAPPLSFNPAPLLERTEAAHNPLAVSFTGQIPAGLERPPRHLNG